MELQGWRRKAIWADPAGDGRRVCSSRLWRQQRFAALGRFLDLFAGRTLQSACSNPIARGSANPGWGRRWETGQSHVWTAHFLRAAARLARKGRIMRICIPPCCRIGFTSPPMGEEGEEEVEGAGDRLSPTAPEVVGSSRGMRVTRPPAQSCSHLRPARDVYSPPKPPPALRPRRKLCWTAAARV